MNNLQPLIVSSTSNRYKIEGQSIIEKKWKFLESFDSRELAEQFLATNLQEFPNNTQLRIVLETIQEITTITPLKYVDIQ